MDHTEGVEDFVNVRSTMFDQPRTEKPFVEVYVGEALFWAVIDAAKSYDALPAVDEWPGLIQQFAARGTAAVEETKS